MLFKRKNTKRENNDFEALDYNIDRIMHTLDAEEFFNCLINVKACYVRLRISENYREADVEGIYSQLADVTSLTNDFLDRLSSSGRLIDQTEIIVRQKKLMTDESYEYFVSLTGMTDEPRLCCGVAFEGDKIYHYLCDIDDIHPGDRVIVPVGKYGDEAVGRVVSVGRYLRDFLPYPLHKMKKIISVLEDGEKSDGQK